MNIVTDLIFLHHCRDWQTQTELNIRRNDKLAADIRYLSDALMINQVRRHFVRFANYSLNK